MVSASRRSVESLWQENKRAIEECEAVGEPSVCEQNVAAAYVATVG